ncbi:hypothetical protein P12x_005113 [Tundrisphaera lichenicola]|uniref:hypothetical protein n=1 Tax=Tundrisphaera lichenicola TaxID=2029860 RepID=UPI003EBB4710
MAQHQHAGQSIATRVQDCEALLRQAIQSLRSADSILDRNEKAQAVDRLSEQLHVSRLKLLKSRISAAKEVQSGVKAATRAKVITSLEGKYDKMTEEGVESILGEFGILDCPIE